MMLLLNKNYILFTLHIILIFHILKSIRLVLKIVYILIVKLIFKINTKNKFRLITVTQSVSYSMRRSGSSALWCNTLESSRIISTEGRKRADRVSCRKEILKYQSFQQVSDLSGIRPKKHHAQRKPKQNFEDESSKVRERERERCVS